MSSVEKLSMEGVERRRQFPWTGAAAFILSLLLTASVASLIYVTINGSIYSCGGAQKGEMLSANVDVSSENKAIQRMEYDTSRQVAFYTDTSGNMIAEDYRKGITMYQSYNSALCYVVPIGTNTTFSHQLGNYIKRYQQGTGMVPVVETEIDVYVLPGEVKDRSFLPQEMNDRCDSYVWATFANQQDVGNREKRSAAATATIAVSCCGCTCCCGEPY